MCMTLYRTFKHFMMSAESKKLKETLAQKEEDIIKDNRVSALSEYLKEGYICEKSWSDCLVAVETALAIHVPGTNDYFDYHHWNWGGG